MRGWIGGALGAALLAGASVAQAATYQVTSAADAGPGSLRWAISQSNAHPGNNLIRIGRPSRTLVIRLKSLLPPLQGPVSVEGALRPGPNGASLPAVALDGRAFINGDDQKSCPGEGGRGFGPNVRSLYGPGLAVVDSGDVRVSNLELRNFCIGVLVLRSHDVRIDHDSIHNTAGAAGVLITGDRGDSAGSSTDGLTNNIVVEYNAIHDTGDGGECTRGVTNVVYRFNTMWESRKRLGVPFSQGAECAGSGDDRISFIGNTITGYSDGLQLNGATNLLVAGNTISGTTYAITAAGSGLIADNVITANRLAIGLSDGSHIALQQNSIFDNGHGDILSLAGSAGGTTDSASPNLGGVLYLGRRSAPAADGIARPPVAATAPSAPALGSASRWDKQPVISGTLAGQAEAHYRIEFFASHSLDAAGKSEGEQFIGAVNLMTDAQGIGGFTFNGPVTPLAGKNTAAYFSATATGPDDATSGFSEPLLLTRSERQRAGLP